MNFHCYRLWAMAILKAGTASTELSAVLLKKGAGEKY